MKKYQVKYSARKAGASGIFYPVSINCSACNEDHAKRQAFDELHRLGYETNHPISVTYPHFLEKQ